MNDSIPRHTAADDVIQALLDAGVTHFFGNFGSDHPELIESLARSRASGRNTPRVVICPFESVALAAAHGHALLSGQAQAVIVHCDVGTQTLGGAVHNVSRARVPVFIFAGETPVTIGGELFGSRNRPVQTLQDVHDQHSIVRSYVKWSAPMKTGQNARQLVLRAMQIASSAPTGPVYVTGAREYLSEAVTNDRRHAVQRYPSLEPAALAPALADEIVGAVDASTRAVLVTASAGRNPAAVAELAALADSLGLAVVESSPTCMNLPTDHPMHIGYGADAAVADADVVIVLDADTAWSQSQVVLNDAVQVYHIDQDPLKLNFVLTHTPASRAACADSLVSLVQLNAAAAAFDIDAARRAERVAHAARGHRAEEAARDAAEEAPADGHISVPFLVATLRGLVDADTLVADETITNTDHVWRHLPRTRPGTYFTSGGSSLGWHGGAAIGMKLARPDATVVALAGDGSYLFSVPSTVHWIASHYSTPFLTIVFNNGGWNATKQNTLRLHPDGVAARDDQFQVNLDPDTDFAAMAGAAGAGHTATVAAPGELESTLRAALAVVRAGTAAVVNVRLAPISAQAF